jgi:dTDP-L-rhamnose 4-epimerase
LYKKILITGGAGFIGTALSLALINKGHKVSVLDNLSEKIHGYTPNKSYLFNLIKDKVEFIKGDVLNKKDWLKALQGQQIVIHLAAETGTGQSMYEIEKYTDVNIKGTSIFLDILANQKKKKQLKKSLLHLQDLFMEKENINVFNMVLSIPKKGRKEICLKKILM